jgi:hypothetical protein
MFDSERADDLRAAAESREDETLIAVVLLKRRAIAADIYFIF